MSYEQAREAAEFIKSKYEGFLGIAVALLGRNHPLGVFVAALFFAVLARGEIFVDAFTPRVSKDIGWVLQAIIILFVACFQIYAQKRGKI
jgi:ABC-type uncharacterized transport system permease subunit